MLIGLAIALLVPNVAAAESWKGEVVRVPEGRTLLVEREAGPSKVVLYGIGCPEPDEMFGRKAIAYVAGLVSDRTVRVEVRRTVGDKTVALVYVPGQKKSLNELLLSQGLAWVHQAYCEDARMCGRWTDTMARAKSRNKGIWSAVPENRPPWSWLEEHS
jgi:endonuclease YncB( thermonuclease family)